MPFLWNRDFVGVGTGQIRVKSVHFWWTYPKKTSQLHILCQSMATGLSTSLHLKNLTLSRHSIQMVSMMNHLLLIVNDGEMDVSCYPFYAGAQNNRGSVQTYFND